MGYAFLVVIVLVMGGLIYLKIRQSDQAAKVAALQAKAQLPPKDPKSN